MFILASASLVRSQLLLKASIPHRVIISGFDENTIEAFEPVELVALLAKGKAMKVTNKFTDKNYAKFLETGENVVLGCDSVFEFEGEVFGKPRDEKEAFDRWKRMSSNNGILHTGHFLLRLNYETKAANSIKIINTIEKVVSTRVYFSDLSDSDIKSYISTGEPFNCAGGFALEGYGGKFISRIDGCYSNVIGLSLPWISKSLAI